MERAEKLWSFLVGLSWSPPVLLLFFLCGIIFTFETGFIQFKAPGKIKKLLKRRSEKNGKNTLSAFEALCTALAGTVGTGNIAGVSLALIGGGPGAIFWLWISAFLGMATKYKEISLSMRHRKTGSDGVSCGGPMYYIEAVLGEGWRPLAVLFAMMGIAASFGMGNLAQCREIADAAEALFSLSPALTGFGLTVIILYILHGGIGRLGKISAILVPVMSLLYLGAGLLIIALRIRDVPTMFYTILREAFVPRAAIGGFSGQALISLVRQGFARGIFSNEAGLGSSPMAHAASADGNSDEQAFLGILEVFVSSLVFCTITAFAMLLSGILDSSGTVSVNMGGGDCAAAAFDAVLGSGAGSLIIRLSLLFFAFSSLISWSYYGRCCLDYLCGGKSSGFIYVLCFSFCCTIGAIIPADFVWELSDTLNALMAIPNLIALLSITVKEHHIPTNPQEN